MTTTAPELIWEDPTPRRSGEPKWAAIIAELKKHPGKWAIIDRGYTLPATNGYTYLKRAGGECTQRKQNDGTYVMYARMPA